MNFRTHHGLRNKLGMLVGIGALLVVPLAVTSSTPSLDGLVEQPSTVIITPRA